MLKHALHRESIQGALEDYLLSNATPGVPQETIWEALKVVVRGHIIALSAADNTLRREKRSELERAVGALEDAHK